MSPTDDPIAPADPPEGEQQVDRVVDVRGALHLAGHEVHDLGWEGVADSAPAIADDTGDVDADQIIRLVDEMGSD